MSLIKVVKFLKSRDSMRSRLPGWESKIDKRLMQIILLREVLISINKIKLIYRIGSERVLSLIRLDPVFIFRRFIRYECVANKNLMRHSTKKD
jgi:hypothetical protein